MNCHYNGLAIIRELGHRGVPVIAYDNQRNIGTYSRYARYYPGINPAEYESRFIASLQNLICKLDEKPVIFPTNDAWAMALANNLETLEKVSYPCVAEKKVIDLLVNKEAFNRYCQQQHYPIPEAWTSANYAGVPPECFPVVIKPISRRKSSDQAENAHLQQIFDNHRLTLARDRDELEAGLLVLGEAREYFFIQEYVAGLSDCMFTVGIYADRAGEVKGIFTGRKLRGYPADYGDCVLGQNEIIPEYLAEMVREFCRKVGYHGIAEFEFKQDARSQVFKLIEVNPRSWSWVGITPACGVSLPWMAYTDSCGCAEVPEVQCRLATGTVKYVRLFNDWHNCLFRYKRNGFPQWSLNLKDWWRSLAAEKLVVAEFGWRDNLPALIAFLNELKHMLTDKRKRSGMRP
jgi:predicted ATP-grasp superfamily ATP-dependent carboligase